MSKCKCNDTGLQLHDSSGLAKPQAVLYVKKQPYALCTDCNGKAAEYPGMSAYQRLKTLVELLIKEQKDKK